MGFSGTGPGAVQMYESAGKENVPPNLGEMRAGMLDDRRLAEQQRYADPAIEPELISGGQINTNAPDWYNKNPMLPSKYVIPTAAKERFQARGAIRLAAKQEGTDRPDPIDPEEVDMLQAMKAQAEFVDFDKWVTTLADPRKPGGKDFLQKVYPDYITRRLAQVHTDFEFAIKNQMIDSWGINTFEDLHWKYLVDNGYIKGPKLVPSGISGNNYNFGMLSPWNYMHKRNQRLKLPFNSATIGERPAPGTDWSTAQSTLGGSNLATLAAQMYQPNLGAVGLREVSSARANQRANPSFWPNFYDPDGNTRGPNSQGGTRFSAADLTN